MGGKRDGRGSLGRLSAFLCALALAPASRAAEPPPVDDPSERPIEPRPAAPGQGANPNWGDDQRRLDEVAADADALCINRTKLVVARVAFIPYAFHQRWRPCHGPERKPLSYDAFYARLGRPDLAAKERARDRLKLTLALGEILLFAGGIGLAIAGAAEDEGALIGVGLSMAFVGFPLLRIVDAGISPMGTNASMAERLASDFNRAPVNRLPVSQSFVRPGQMALVLPILQLRF